VREDRRAVRPIEWNRSNFPGARLLRRKKGRKKKLEERLLLALYKTEGASALLVERRSPTISMYFARARGVARDV